MKKKSGPEPGTVPNFAGVAGSLVSEIPEGLLFGERKTKTSPYDPLLLQLKAAGAGKYLRFEDLRARASVLARSRKLNIKVTFAEDGNILFVGLAQVELALDAPAPEPKQSTTMTDLVLGRLKELAPLRAATSGEMTTWLRSNGGGPAVGIGQVDGIFATLLRAGKIKMKPSSRGGEATDAYVLA